MAVPANDRFLRALRREPTDRTPAWIMRQAGRYLPEYRELRARAGSFLALCKTPEYACEAALQPLRRYDLDAAIVFSDILTIPDAMGLGLAFVDGEGPRFERPLRSAADIRALGIPDPATELRYVPDAVSLLAAEVGAHTPVIGFAGSPWTLAVYMVEGRGRSDFARVRGLMQESPGAFAHLLELLADALAVYLRAQITAGAHAVMVFDSWGGALDDEDYLRCSVEPLARVMDALGDAVPRIAYARGGGAHLEAVAATGCEAVGVDETVDLGSARLQIGDRCAVQGNLDAACLRLPPEDLRRSARAVLDSYGAHPGHVFNLGHGITPDIDPERLEVLLDEVRCASAT